MISKIKLLDKEFKIFIKDNEIQKIVESISTNINKLQVKNPLFIAVLNGSFLFASDIMRKITLPDAEISFIKLSSYSGTKSTGNVNELIGLNKQIKKRNVIILEDIVDTGNTLEKIIEILKEKKVASYKIATLLFKPDAFTKNVAVGCLTRCVFKSSLPSI